jgi:hypothetical protein
MQALYGEWQELGRGPHATVYRARDQVLGRTVAIKELQNWTDRSAAAVVRLRFAHAQPLLHPPHTLQACIADAERGRLAMDFIPAGSLGDRITRDGRSLAPALVRQVLIGALEALAPLHRQGLLHGAVKPNNLFVDGSGQVLLADGLGLSLSAKRIVYPAPLTPEEEKYLAPEWADTVGAAADLYSLGLALLELLLAGDFELLFPQVLGRAIAWTEWHRSERQLPPVKTLVPSLPRDLASVLDRLLRKRPEERYPSAVEALESIRPAPHGYRRWGGPVLVAGGCIAAVVLAVLLVMRPWETEANAQSAGDAQLIQELRKERDAARAVEKQNATKLAEASKNQAAAQEAEKKLAEALEQQYYHARLALAERAQLERQLAEARAEVLRLTPPTRRLRHLW